MRAWLSSCKPREKRPHRHYTLPKTCRFRAGHRSPVCLTQHLCRQRCYPPCAYSLPCGCGLWRPDECSGSSRVWLPVVQRQNGLSGPRGAGDLPEPQPGPLQRTRLPCGPLLYQATPRLARKNGHMVPPLSGSALESASLLGITYKGSGVSPSVLVGPRTVPIFAPTVVRVGNRQVS